MSVTSRPIRRTPRVDIARAAVVVMVMITGLVGWLADAKYTASGWLTGLNMVSAWMSQPLQMSMPTTPYWFVAVLLAFGLIYSLVEFGTAPRRWWRSSNRLIYATAFIFAIATDLISTVIDVLSPAANAVGAELWLAQTPALAAIWAIIIAFLPEALLLGGWKLLREVVE